MSFRPNAGELGEELTAELGRLKTGLKQLWARSQHPHFTHHGLEHSESILRKLEAWLSKTTLRLSEDEAFILTAAAYLHDLGMQCQNRDLLVRVVGFRDQEWPWGRSELNQIRIHHHTLSYEMIRDACAIPGEQEYPDLALNLSNHHSLYTAVALLALGHVAPPDAFPRGIVSDYPLDRGPVNLLLLAHLLRVGDALDATEARVNRPEVAKAWGTLNPVDKFHTLKHQYVASVDMAQIGTFRFTYRLPEEARPHAKEIARSAEAHLRSHIKHAGPLLAEAKVPLYAAESRFEDGNAPRVFSLDADTVAIFQKSGFEEDPDTRKKPLPKSADGLRATLEALLTATVALLETRIVRRRSADGSSEMAGWHNDFPNDRIGSIGTALPLIFLHRRGHSLCGDPAIISFLKSSQREGGWAVLSGFDMPTVDATVWPLHALALSGDASARDAITAGAKWLIDQQKEDGGWGSTKNAHNPPRILMTARAVECLLGLPFIDQRLALGSGISWLVRIQRNDGSWGPVPGEDGTVAHTAIALRALLRAGIRRESQTVMSALTYIRKNWNCNGSGLLETLDVYRSGPEERYFRQLIEHDVDAEVVSVLNSVTPSLDCSATEVFVKRVADGYRTLGRLRPPGQKLTVWNTIPQAMAIIDYVEQTGGN